MAWLALDTIFSDELFTILTNAKLSNHLQQYYLSYCFPTQAISSGSNPNATTAKHHLFISLGCTIFAVALASIGIIVIILVIVLLVKY